MEFAKIHSPNFKLSLLLLICSFEFGLGGKFNSTYFRYCDGKDDYDIKVKNVTFPQLPGSDVEPWTMNITASIPKGKRLHCKPTMLFKMIVRRKTDHDTTEGQFLLCDIIDIHKSSSSFVIYGMGGNPGKSEVPKSIKMWILDLKSVRNLTCIVMGEWAQDSRPHLF